MAFKHFYQELINGLPLPIYILYSADDIFLYDALTLIKEKYNYDSFNFDIFDLKSPDGITPISDVIGILKTPPFLSGKRVVIMRNSQKISKKDIELLQDYFLNPSENSVLIMLFEGSNPKIIDQRSSKIVKVINLNLSNREIPLWIKEKAMSMGYSLTEDAIGYLINMIGDVGLIYSELRKFSSLNKKSLDVQDIEGVVHASAEYSAFDLIDALKKRDKSQVFRIYETIKDSIEPIMLLGALNYYYSTIVERGLEAGKSKKIFKLLHEADIGIKTSKSFVVEELLSGLLKI
jgi:DNA polymerase-3 subunit delta